ncbi:MAG: hypothetical protein WDA07_06250 [Leucobacter sp.]
MASAARSYEVLDNETGKSVVVLNATTQAEALRAVARDKFAVSALKPQRAFELGRSGVKTIVLGAEAEMPEVQQSFND